jgi:hypothetical protein
LDSIPFLINAGPRHNFNLKKNVAKNISLSFNFLRMPFHIMDTGFFYLNFYIYDILSHRSNATANGIGMPMGYHFGCIKHIIDKETLL